jgi:amidohydrolase
MRATKEILTVVALLNVGACEATGSSDAAGTIANLDLTPSVPGSAAGREPVNAQPSPTVNALPSAPPASRPVNDRDPLHGRIDQLAPLVVPHVIANRHYIHQHPERSNREFETGKYIARKLRELGVEVWAPAARTGVVGVLRGGKSGPGVALRAELDALAGTEAVDVPFKSTVPGVMHACGHDAHMALLLGVAEVFAQMKDQLPGTIKFLFQPGEEGPPPGETDGAVALIEEGVLTKEPRTEVIFGLHVVPTLETGQIGYRSGGLMGSDDLFDIVVRGRQTDGETPWAGVDPIVVAAQIVLGLQTITSRQMDIVKAPVVVTVERIAGGERLETVPDHVDMSVMLRAFDPQMRDEAKMRIRNTAQNIAAASGATAEVVEAPEMATPGVYNDPRLTERMLPTLERVVGDRGLVELRPQPYADDFSFFTGKVPGLFVLMGIRKKGATLDEYPINHSPYFKIDETSYELGVRTLANLVVDYMLGAPQNR